MHLATLTYQVPADLVEAVGRAVNEVLSRSPDLSCVQATAAGEVVSSPASSATLLAGPRVSGGPDGDRSNPSSSAGGAKMDRASTPAPGQSDVDASGTHNTEEEQAVPHSSEREPGNPEVSAISNTRVPSGDSRPAARGPLENAAKSPAGGLIKHGCQQPGSCRIKFKTTAICWQCRDASCKARASA